MEFAKILEKLETYDPFTFFASGIAQIAEEIDKLDENKLKLLNSSFSSNVTTESMSTATVSPATINTNGLSNAVNEVEKLKATTQVSNVTGAASNSMPSEITIHLNGPFKLENGDTIGQIAYDAIIKREEEIATGMSLGRPSFRYVPKAI
jgi:hypothetical protein